MSARTRNVMLLGFDWCHTADSSVTLSLSTGETGLASLIARGITEDDRDVTVARLGRAPDARRVSRVVERLIATNGASCKIELFGSLPSGIANHRPDWIGRETVARACRAWLDAFGADLYGSDWSDLASGLPPMGDDGEDEAPVFDEARKRRIAAAYIDDAYREVASQRRKRA